MPVITINAPTRRFLAFAKTSLRFVEGTVTGQPVEFEPWLVGITNELLRADYWDEDKQRFVRQYTSAYIGLPKKNNKSTWAAALALGFLCVESVDSIDGGMQVYAIAASKQQARVVFGAAKKMVEASPELSDPSVCEVLRDSIVYKPTGAVFMVLSSDAPKRQGLNPSIVICDELHAHEDGELYDALLTAMIARDEPLMVTITNAGSNERGESKCAEVYRRGKAGKDPRMFFHSPSVADDDLDNMAAWLRVNPASWITAAKLRAFQKAMPPFRFERFHLNRWTRAEREWLPKGAWDLTMRPGSGVVEGEKVVAALDLSKSKDATALTLAAPRWADEAHTEVKYGLSLTTWRAWPDADDAPPDAHHAVEGDTIPFGLIADELRRICRVYDVVEILYDPWGIPEMVATELQAEGLPMVEYPQNVTLMAPASQGLFEAVTEGKVEHDDDEIYAAHIAAATPRDVGYRGWRLDKDLARSPSDGAITTAMAIDRVRDYPPPSDTDYVIRHG